MIHAIIVDDEQHCINHLRRLFAVMPGNDVHLVAEAQTLEDGLDAIKRYSPEVVFLDVQLHDKTGFDLLLQLPVINFDVIFTTAYDKYAVQAFKFSAVDYLLKPVDAADLQHSLEKVKHNKQLKQASEKMDVLFHNLKAINGQVKRICVPVSNGLEFLQVADILRCESHVNYTTLFLKDKRKLLVSKTLKEFEELLTEYNFFRVHNSHLINLAYIKSYNKGKGGVVVMTDGSQIDVSTRRKEDFLKRMQG
ncbi:MAG TPA: LytTR family DNA-binding domain-containing protein [Chitinophagaceae bacterium]|nr:LytTR family DNA-binding domain-containing protein [Chitinophagaceae bacterium]